MIAVWHTTHRPNTEHQQWPLADIEAILTTGDLPTDLFARTFCDEQARRGLGISGHYHHGDPFGAFTGWDDYLNRHVATVREVLTRPNATGQTVAIQTLARLGFDFTPLVDVLVQVGTGVQKTAREAVLPLLLSSRDLARPLVDKALAEGDAVADTRRSCSYGGSTGRGWRPFTATGRVGIVRPGAADDRETAGSAHGAGRGRGAVRSISTCPPVQMETGVVPFPPEAVAGLRETYQRGYQEVLREYEQRIERSRLRATRDYVKNFSQAPTPVRAVLRHADRLH